MTTRRFTMASSSGNTIASGRSFGGMCWTNKKFACPSIIRMHECALHSCVVSVHARPSSYLCILCTHTETIFYGDACPVIAGNETIKFDDFEMDQTSVRRTPRCVVLSVPLFVAYQAHTCNCLVCPHHVLYQVCTCSRVCIRAFTVPRRTDFEGGVVWWQDYTLMKRRGAHMVCNIGRHM